MTTLEPTRLSDSLLAELDEFLVELNAAAAGAILPLFRGEHGLSNKYQVGFDPVTEADKGAERAIRALIAARYPDHGIIGEEYGEDRRDAEFVWVLDPVDGTRAFIAGLPLWTTLIGLRFQGTPEMGSIGQSYLGEVYLGHAGASRLVTAAGERALKVRPCPKLTDAIIATTDPEMCFRPAELAAWTQVRAAAKLARLGCDAYAMVALGAIDLAVDTGLKTWDVEAAVPVIEGAGGVVTDWTGAQVGPSGGQIAIAGDRACLDEALVALKRAAA